MRKTSVCLLIWSAFNVSGLAHAEQPFVPDQVIVEKEIKPGPNVFVIDQSWSGSSMITVFGSDDLSAKGNISTGLISQFNFSHDKSKLFTASVYPKRIVWGEIEAVVQKFDVKGLSLETEIPSSPKMAQVSATVNSFAISADDQYAFVQNATPAASVSVIDLSNNKQVLEVPTPGCWGIYASQSASKFSALCGDGTVTTYQLSSDATSYEASKSKKIFDTDSDALFITSQRDGNKLMFTSFNGNMYVLDDSGNTASLIEKFNYTEGVDGGWLPGGYEVIAYNKPNNMMFVTMHPDGHEGSHKDGATEIWGIDMESHDVVTRIEAEEPISLAVSQTESPDVFALTDWGIVTKYTFSGNQFEGKKQAEIEGAGGFTQMLMVDY